MLYKSTKTNSWNTLSTLKGKLGTRMTGTGSTVLVATSWTGELLAPAYKKSVYVKGNPAGAKVTLMDGKTPAKTHSLVAFRRYCSQLQLRVTTLSFTRQLTTLVLREVRSITLLLNNLRNNLVSDNLLAAD